ncbi:hypothetical protein ANME2D_00022 [Candidatus Methanoperedens nitroreducens]|uniref:Uncharacterized protein n=1 Tax=Candidatus Methanoperedens nitratireducens TaxID=1392998 RepID=A0A062VBB7_9EURY|nr:hypothetical protein [Candidatus Methanoperedens nitroreducens]KCZ72964.1 hypothetical protein ANME2D_00022 [Candidatus Methanoperedens nitroreducens]MDJ1423093.1 hypothetical protein [Candidatus Methanoperedens sp.]
MEKPTALPGLQDILEFGFIEALLGRRSRRFFLGAEIPDGVFAYKSRHAPVPLTELEKLLVVTACGSNTGWHHMIYRAQLYAPYLSNYAGAAGGRTFPSAAGFHTSMTFFTDDEGVYVLDARDAPAFAQRKEDGSLELDVILDALKSRIRKIQDGRLGLPPEVLHTEAHNTWVTNQPGTLLVIPVGDLSQHVLLMLCYMLQNGLVLTDDINRRPIPGIEKFRDIVDINNTWPLTFVEQMCMAELTAELSTSCYAGTLMLQAMGLGGWMFDGLNPFSVIGASGEPGAPGLGFRYDSNERWPYPNPTGLEGIMEGFCPPHYPDMRAAVEAVHERKFGPGGPFHPDTPGPWKDSVKVRSAAQVHSEEFRECVALQAQYVFDTFGKFPGTVPSIFLITYLQAHHLDLEFYDRFYKPGAYLKTHAMHMKRWHGEA